MYIKEIYFARNPQLLPKNRKMLEQRVFQNGQTLFLCKSKGTSFGSFFFILLRLSWSYDEYSLLWAPGYLFRIIVLMFPRANSPENRLRWILKSRITVPSIEPWRTCSFRLTTGLGRQKSSILITCLLLCWHCTLHQRVKAGLGELNTLFQRWVYHCLMLDKLVQRTPQKEVNLWTASRQDALHIFLLCSLFWQK